ncbi:unnamed protein product [Cuscuta epithymum]|uniref:Uncharacterized protein n=1 Tax=Cuscuta epithymum TaxID=186058 RepID=A0AAV0DNC9_9ASTE|nr:unnamed protein product [Cuscuta epithymum]
MVFSYAFIYSLNTLKHPRDHILCIRFTRHFICKTTSNLIDLLQKIRTSMKRASLKPVCNKIRSILFSYFFNFASISLGGREIPFEECSRSFVIKYYYLRPTKNGTEEGDIIIKKGGFVWLILN